MDRVRTILACVGLLLGGAGLATLLRPERYAGFSPDRPANDPQLRALRERMQLLEKQLGPDRLGRAGGSRHLSNGEDTEEEGGDGSPAEIEAARKANRERTDRRYAFIQAALEDEPVDREWARQTEQEILDAASGLDSGSVVSLVECHSTLCKVEVEHAGVAEGELFRGDLVMRVKSLPRATMRRVPSDGAAPERSVMYLVRAGHRLPKPSEDAAP